jgi:WhiB family redox-sensing transcriptional regulator
VTIAIDGNIGGQGLGRSEARTASEALDLFGRRPGCMRDGLCREHAEVNFYPRTGESLEPARAICAGCLVRDSCLAHALEHDERHGVWGGLSPRERGQLRRLRRAS